MTSGAKPGQTKATSSHSAPVPPHVAVGVRRDTQRRTTGPVEGCRASKGHWCQNTVPNCVNCRGTHFAQATAYPKKKTARDDAECWRSPSSKWR